MRVVLDTNVLMSGVFFAGPPAKILAAWQRRQISLCASAEIMEEYVAVGERLRADCPGVDPGPVMAVVVSHAILVDAKPLPQHACADPDDDKFIACALAAKCRYVVTGDRALLAVGNYESVRMIRPRAFYEAHFVD